MTTFVHANGQTGVLPAAIGAADTSINLGRVWTGAGGTAKLIFDPALAGIPNPNMEIAYATVTNGSPTAAGVQRGQEGTAAVPHGQAAIWVCGPTGLDIDSLFANPMTTLGDVIVGGAAGAATRLPAGAGGNVLTMTAGSPAWAANSALFNPMTTAGDLIVGLTGGSAARLGVGGNGQILTVSAGTPVWAANAAMTNPMTTVGDIIVGGASGTPTRQAQGANGSFLGVSGGVLGYYTPAGTGVSTVTSGDPSINIGGTAANPTVGDLTVSAFRATGALVETASRVTCANTNVPTSATLYLMAIPLQTGTTIGHIAFVTSTGGATMSHWWFGLYDNNRNQLAMTADQGAAGWASNTVTSLAIATIASGASSTFTTTYTGLHYLGIMVAYTGTISLPGSQIVAPSLGIPPILAGSGDSGQTTPPAFPHQSSALTAVTIGFYGYVAA